MVLLKENWVLVAKTRSERGSKLDLKWEHTAYRVEKQPFPLTSVYDVVSEGSNPSKRHLHRNLLQPCVLSADFSAKPARDREEQDSVYVRPIQKVPPLVLEPPAFTDLEKGSSSTVPVNSIKAVFSKFSPPFIS